MTDPAQLERRKRKRKKKILFQCRAIPASIYHAVMFKSFPPSIDKYTVSLSFTLRLIEYFIKH
jgi:hypothetical protein